MHKIDKVMRKYEIYILQANYGEVQEEFCDYREAFRRYHIVDGPATLYGIDGMGGVSVIFSR